MFDVLLSLSLFKLKSSLPPKVKLKFASIKSVVGYQTCASESNPWIKIIGYGIFISPAKLFLLLILGVFNCCLIPKESGADKYSKSDGRDFDL